MIKNKFYDIKQKALKKYIGTFCESSNENEAVKKIREILKLDDSWEASYKIEDYSNNITVTFSNGSDFVEIKFMSTVGNSTGYSILVNEKRIVSKSEQDDVRNIVDFINKDRLFTTDLLKVNNEIDNTITGNNI